jgi:hypothetical protein
MAKLIIDTSSWFELEKPRFQEVFSELEEQVNTGKTVLLTCDIIIDEWTRNKEKILREIITSIKSHAKSAEKLSDFIVKAEADFLRQILEKYKSDENEQLKVATQYFQKVELLLQKSEKYSIADDLKIKMANRALTKQAPFHNSKNNMADALLLYGAVDHVKSEYLIATNLFFVSANYTEFADPENSLNLHPELAETGVHFYNNVARALQMRKELVDEMDEHNERKFWDLVDMQEDMALDMARGI